jgi:hypothetical protein
MWEIDTFISFWITVGDTYGNCYNLFLYNGIVEKLGEGLIDLRIKFKPITKIKRYVKGQRLYVFVPSKTYEAIKYPDGTILAISDKSDKPIKVSENDIIILEFIQ